MTPSWRTRAVELLLQRFANLGDCYMNFHVAPAKYRPTRVDVEALLGRLLGDEQSPMDELWKELIRTAVKMRRAGVPISAFIAERGGGLSKGQVESLFADGPRGVGWLAQRWNVYRPLVNAEEQVQALRYRKREQDAARLAEASRRFLRVWLATMDEPEFENRRDGVRRPDEYREKEQESWLKVRKYLEQRIRALR